MNIKRYFQFVRIYILMIIAFTAVAPIQAQYDFREGFIIPAPSDTVRGFIDNTQPEWLSQKCVFRAEEDAPIVIYSPLEIEGYGFNGRLFLSRRIKNGDEEQNLFLEFIAGGKMQLYYSRDKGGETFYIEKEGKIYELTNREIEIIVDGKRKMKHTNKYLGMLNYLMSDSEIGTSRINTTDFSQTSLVKLLYDYHKEIGEDESFTVYQNNEKKGDSRKWNFDYGIFLSTSYNSLSTVSEILGRGSYSGTAYFRRINVSDPFQSEILSLSPGAYLNINRNGRINLQTGVEYRKQNFSNVSLNGVNIPLFLDVDLLRYRKVIPFLSAGLGFSFFKYSISENIYINYEELIDVENIIYAPSAMVLGPGFWKKNFLERNIGLGLKWYIKEDLPVKLRFAYTHSNLFSNNPNLTINPVRYYAMVNKNLSAMVSFSLKLKQGRQGRQ